MQDGVWLGWCMDPAGLSSPHMRESSVRSMGVYIMMTCFQAEIVRRGCVGANRYISPCMQSLVACTAHIVPSFPCWMPKAMPYPTCIPCVFHACTSCRVPTHQSPTVSTLYTPNSSSSWSYLVYSWFRKRITCMRVWACGGACGGDACMDRYVQIHFGICLLCCASAQLHTHA